MNVRGGGHTFQSPCIIIYGRPDFTFARDSRASGRRPRDA
jgi:hypothetical protein